MRMMITIRSLLLSLMMLAVSAASFAQVNISVTIAPPELPVYEQPICPGDGYIWTPGYWSWADDDYFWVPGTWVEAPEVGFFWTPAYWGWGGSSFVFYDGYWGPTIGFYGGINYGFGYFGHGFDGGRWDNGHFFYNRAVANVNVEVIHNVYETKVENNVNVTRVSFNGGNGGVNARPTTQEEAASHERHVGPVAAQTEHIQAARSNQQLRASVNHGKPPIAATPKPGAFNDHAAVAAKEGAPYNATANREANANGAARTENGAARPATAVHPKDLPPAERPAAPNTGNPNLDKKYQQQQDKLQQKQDQERQKLQQKQDQEHQQQAKQNTDNAKQQQLEQKHQQQTQQLAQRHTQQQQQLQQRQAPPPAPRPAKPHA